MVSPDQRQGQERQPRLHCYRLTLHELDDLLGYLDYLEAPATMEVAELYHRVSGYCERNNPANHDRRNAAWHRQADQGAIVPFEIYGSP
jgi:hypothetical protein